MTFTIHLDGLGSPDILSKRNTDVKYFCYSFIHLFIQQALAGVGRWDVGVLDTVWHWDTKIKKTNSLFSRCSESKGRDPEINRGATMYTSLRACQHTLWGHTLWVCSSDLRMPPWASHLSSLCLNFLSVLSCGNMKELILLGGKLLKEMTFKLSFPLLRSLKCSFAFLLSTLSYHLNILPWRSLLLLPPQLI